jgi:hypothetical protein
MPIIILAFPTQAGQNNRLCFSKDDETIMGLDSIGRLLLVVGVGLAVLGGILLLLSKVPFLSQLGNLPGDIRIQGQGFSCFVPLASMILISIVLTVALNIVIRLINR